MTRRLAGSGAHKVAAFLLSLDKETSARVMKGLDPKVLGDVAQAMTDLSPELCSVEAVDKLYMDLARTVYQRMGVRSQDDFELHTILEGTFGNVEADRVIAAIHDRRRQSQPFGFLELAIPEVVVRALSDESPMVISLVLAHVSPRLSAEVLSSLPAESALEIVKHMTTLVPPTVETMLLVADCLEARMKEVASGPPPRESSQSLKTVAELLNFSKSDTEKVVLDGLQKESEEVAQGIREFMFNWDNLADVDKRAMQKILASVETRAVALALKACPPAVESNIMNNLSARVREMVADERTLAGAVPMAEVLTARADILKIVRALIESGEFSPARAGEEMVT